MPLRRRGGPGKNLAPCQSSGLRAKILPPPGNLRIVTRFPRKAREETYFRSLTNVCGRKTGGKQYRVTIGEKLKVEQIPADIDSQIVLDQVLMVADGDQVAVGTPLVAGATVTATVVSHGRGEKIRIFKMRRRGHYQKHQGHRQNYTEIRIDAISK